MISVVSFPFVDGKSGGITFTPPSSYVAATGWASCQTGRDMIAGTTWRAFFNFDTSSIPNHAQVTKVEFLIQLSTLQLEEMPEIYRLKFSIGTFIGVALDGNDTEFNAGTLMVTLTGSKPADNTWLDLDLDGNGPEPYVNLGGDTDIKVWDDSIQGGGDSYWSTDFNSSKAKCKLRVTYQVPTATATGRGTASTTATVTTSGSATAIGSGTSQAEATVTAAGSGAVTGSGTAQAVAVVAVAGSSLATGRGTAFCQAIVENISASTTSTGRGFASCRLVAVYVEPVARHSGMRSVRPAHAAARAVSWARERTCAAGRMN